MKLEDLVDKEPYRKVEGHTCKPNILYLDADTNLFLEAYFEPRGIENERITHFYKHNGTLYCWYKRTDEEKGLKPYVRKEKK